MRRSSTILRLGGVILAVAVLVAAAVLLLREPDRRSVTAYFGNAVGLYPGADVRILGIPVGEVTKVTPTTGSVKVEIEYEAKYKVPRDAKAVIVSQALVSDRYVQLTPVYRSGPVMPDGHAIDLADTVVPVEVDQVYGSLNDLSEALGPDGANQKGSLSRLLEVGADTIEGEGENIRETIRGTSKMLNTLSGDREDVAATIENLKIITGAMADNDRQIKQFTENLSGVSGQLAGETEELDAALRTLAPTLRNVQRFIEGNRTDLAKNVRQLAQITGVLVKRKDELAEVLQTGPMAINNLARAYDPISGTINNRADLRNFENLADWICSLAYSVGTPAKQCLDFMAPYADLGHGLTGLGLDLSWITALTTHYDPVPIPPDAYGPGDGPDRPTATAPRDVRTLLPGGDS